MKKTYKETTKEAFKETIKETIKETYKETIEETITFGQIIQCLKIPRTRKASVNSRKPTCE